MFQVAASLFVVEPWFLCQAVFVRFVAMLQDFDVLVMHSCDHDLCNEGVSKQRSGFGGREKLAGLKLELSDLFSQKRKNASL